MLRASWFWTVIFLGSAASLALFWLTDAPLGVPGEWTWSRHEVTPDLIANALTCLVSGAAYLAFVAWGYRRLARPECSRRESLAWAIALMVMAGVWIGTVQGTGATGPTIGRWPFVLYYPSSSGYFFKARFESPRARELLRHYEALMQEGDVLHVGTHPPGLFLFFHGLIGLMDSVSGLAGVVNATQPETIREAFAVIQENAVKSSPLTSNDQAVMWLAALISFSLCAATAGPMYGFARCFADRPASWLAASAWPLVPAISMFLPKSDAAFAFPAMFLGWLWLVAWRRSSIGLACLAGAVWSIAILCSLAFLPVALWLALLSLLDSRPELRRALRTILPAGVVCLGLLAALSAWGGVPLWKTFWLNYQNHAGFYARYPRTYLAWLAVNPLELAFAVGWPLFLTSACAIGGVLLRWRDADLRRWLAPCLATAIVWGWLWLSGKNSGEAARLWIFLMPYLTVCTAVIWSGNPSSPTESRLPRPVLIWLLCQALVCFGTVQRINGFAL